MKDDTLIQESAHELVAWFTNAAQNGEAFVIEQAPLYAQEVVAWTFWSNFTIVATALLALAVLLVVGIVGFRKLKSDEFETGFPLTLLGFGFSIIPFLIASTAVLDAIQALVAPRVVILEHIQGLL